MPTGVAPIHFALLFCGSVLPAGCAQEGATTTGRRPEAVVYGDDDRRDWHRHPDEALRQRARESVVAMIPPSQASGGGDGTFRFPWTADLGLCPTEPFGDQPTAADCSGTLIDTDLVLTAGHCVPGLRACRSYWYVFDYLYAADGRLETVDEDDVFFCDELLVLEDGDTDPARDYAIVRLDRPVDASRRPAPLRPPDGPALLRGEPVAMAGFPLGLPMKLDSGGVVVDAGGGGVPYFEATVDAFGGSSGSGVLDANLDLVGVLARGSDDFVESGDCLESNRLPDGEGPAEEASFAALAVEDLCAAGWPSVALCGAEPRCGDGFCAFGEADACPGDCPASSTPPDTWVCPDAWFDVRDGCDCDCGAQDPDCADPGAAVHGCDEGARCVAGACVDPGPATPRARKRNRGCGVASDPPGSTVLGLATVWLGFRRPRRRPSPASRPGAEEAFRRRGGD